MDNFRKISDFIEHGSTCACMRDEQASCDCFYSALAKTAVFQPATARGPAGAHGRMDEYERAEIQDYVAGKQVQSSERSLQQASSSQLYSPLMKGDIRILELHPGEHAAAFEGSLHVASIDFSYSWRKAQGYNSPSKGSGLTERKLTNHAVFLATGEPLWYTALSYVWGPPVFDNTISFRQGVVKITSSLASALRQLRSTEHGVFLWIDQICINQPDTAEKVQQIPLMGMIYTHATNTIIWLGDEEDSDPVLAFKTMENVFVRLQGTDAQVTPEDFERLDFPPSTDRSWWAVKQLLRRSWFTRLWTIQEAYLSVNLFLGSGPEVVCWDDFAAWCLYIQESGLSQWLTTNDTVDSKHSKTDLATSLPPQGAAIVNSIQAARLHGLTLVHKEYLLNILVSTRYAQATEPKDKIYGVLGMAESTITPNYSPVISAREVYHEACLSQLPRDMYELLSCIDHDSPHQPSWIPDWSAPRVTTALGYSTKASTLYRAGAAPVTGQQHCKVDLSEDNNQVTLSGKIFDNIATLGCVFQNPILDIDNPQAANRELASYVDIVRNATQSQTYPGPGTSIYEAFLHTLLAGRDGSGIAPPSQDHSEVFSLILDSTTGQMPSLPRQTYSPRRQKGFFTLNSLKTRKPAKTLEDLETAIRAALKMRRFAITGRGFFALVPRGTQVGDELVVFDRACVPFVLRKKMNDLGDVAGYEMLGEAYVHGIMRGEVMEMNDVKLTDVTLV